MGEIELVIKIPEDTYAMIKKMLRRNGTEYMNELEEGVAFGTPLPKGHGRLIDADELDECKEIMTTINHESKYAVRMDDIRSVPTIIEADTESEEKK